MAHLNAALSTRQRTRFHGVYDAVRGRRAVVDAVERILGALGVPVDVAPPAAIAGLQAVDGQGQRARPEPLAAWLATTRPDGRPHVAGVGALWVDGRLYFTSGDGTRKSRNLAANPHCAVALSLPDLDLVVEGTAARVTDEATLARLAERYAAQGWPATVSDGAITAPYSAPSAGPPPWDLYVVTPVTAFGVATAEPYGATRWRFG